MGRNNNRHAAQKRAKEKAKRDKKKAKREAALARKEAKLRAKEEELSGLLGSEPMVEAVRAFVEQDSGDAEVAQPSSAEPQSDPAGSSETE